MPEAKAKPIQTKPKPEMLTPSEVEWLRRKSKETSDFAQKAFAKDKEAKAPTRAD